MPPPANAIVAQSGGPTAVINQSLVGVVDGLRSNPKIGKILGGRHGVRGITAEQFVDLSSIPPETLNTVANTPSAALGSSRDKPDRPYCERVLAALKKNDVRYFFYIGGNDSSDTCRIVSEMARESGYGLHAYHCPKTVDNDLMMNDHTPGYASAARYVAKAFLGDSLDNRSLPGIKINVIMGRHAGFLTAAAALARHRDDDGPQLIYLPEVVFDIERFVADVDRVYSKLGRCQIALSEGVQNDKGEAIAATLIAGEKDAHGNVQLSGSGALGDMLAEFIKKKLTPAGGKAPRVRADTLGYPQRCYPDASPIDQKEARESARTAAEAALKGDHLDGSIAIQRASSSPYQAKYVRVELKDVAAKTRHMPPEFIKGTSDVTPAFTDWLRPLVGEMPKIAWL
ncbi:MAG TPA: 6-phosphofructokinase [Phycisphaerales bacterium]|nr:6-phosphofructokinase [Phycisphaerales bacterium]